MLLSVYTGSKADFSQAFAALWLVRCFDATLEEPSLGALSNDSFISAASFQKSIRVLTEAVIMGKRDGLPGRVIIGVRTGQCDLLCSTRTAPWRTPLPFFIWMCQSLLFVCAASFLNLFNERSTLSSGDSSRGMQLKASGKTWMRSS
jgi:hypothetical protein